MTEYTKNEITGDMSKYSIILHKDEQGVYHVTVPALPGCVTFGYTEEEARKKAEEVIELWLKELISQQQPLPKEEEEPKMFSVSIMHTTNLKAA